tara:strand:- start:2589 stop:3338 length:750 start_codon:yes stop_codon:yes gene_type:complete
MIKISKEMRRLILSAAYHANHGHIPSALSMVEIFVTLDKIKTDDDIILLSKGHGCLSLYSMLVIQGHIDEKELLTFGKKGSKLGGHPDRNKLDKIYASTGSLGHGLPIAIGASMAKKIKNQSGRVFCIIGDGEMNEGSIWESLLIASKNKLDNLICIVDNNSSQIRSLPSDGLFEKFKSFGWYTKEEDGHDIDSIMRAIQVKLENDKPMVVIANTLKGKGIKEIENDMFAWHHRSPTDDEFKRFIKEIG